mmetsp:Transcript_15092/g.36511  ORF Transcript_15092/g.36511 Transcript_15092/m.36511 type:complete len:129 (-) Transcript_15092:112-498(-)
MQSTQSCLPEKDHWEIIIHGPSFSFGVRFGLSLLGEILYTLISTFDFNRGEKPMSGFYAIIFLLQVCDELDIYGFTPFKEDDSHTMLSTAYHYFDWATPRKGSHSFDLTRYIYEMLDIAFPGRFKLHD